MKGKYIYKYKMRLNLNLNSISNYFEYSRLESNLDSIVFKHKLNLSA